MSCGEDSGFHRRHPGAVFHRLRSSSIVPYAIQWEQLSLPSTSNQRVQRKPYSDIQNRRKSYLNGHKDQVLFSLAFDKVAEAQFHASLGRSVHTKRGDLFQHF